jgi:hypothetical protein
MALAVKVIAAKQLNSTLVTDVSNAVLPGKAQIIKSMRFANTNTSAPVTLNLYFARSSPPELQIAPKNLSIAAGQIYVDDTEITLEPGDRIRGSVSTGGVVDCIISGIERDA